MAAPDLAFRANPTERLLQPRPALQGPGWRVALLGAGLLYAVLLGLLVLDEVLWPAPPAQIQEIPVEVVVAPPPEPPPAPPQPEQQPEPPAAKPLDEKPAFDAPRQANNDKQDSEAQDDSKKAAPPEAAKAPTPQPEAAKPQEAAKEEPRQQEQPAAAAPEGSPETAPDGEMSPQKPTPSEQHAEAEVPKEAHAPDNPGFPTFDSVPDLDAGAFAKPAPIAGGRAKATYLSTIYGMIMARVHFPNTPRPAGGRLEGTIVFSVDAMGGLITRSIIHSSGSRALDDAAYEAVGKAAPFPRPPTGAPIGLRFTYGAN
jgi:protein TonB